MTNKIVRRFYRTRRCRSRSSRSGEFKFYIPKILILVGRLFVVGFLLTTVNPCIMGYSRVYAQDAEIYIENKEFYRSKSRPAVYFSHEIHMEAYECLYCHHDYQDGKNILSEDDLDEEESAACAQCHEDNASIELKTAYHRQCMGCHRQINNQEAAVLPITCGDCHNRRSPHQITQP